MSVEFISITISRKTGRNFGDRRRVNRASTNNQSYDWRHPAEGNRASHVVLNLYFFELWSEPVLLCDAVLFGLVEDDLLEGVVSQIG
jgi:hypothetical protein